MDRPALGLEDLPAQLEAGAQLDWVQDNLFGVRDRDDAGVAALPVRSDSLNPVLARRDVVDVKEPTVVGVHLGEQLPTVGQAAQPAILGQEERLGVEQHDAGHVGDVAGHAAAGHDLDFPYVDVSVRLEALKGVAVERQGVVVVGDLQAHVQVPEPLALEHEGAVLAGQYWFLNPHLAAAAPATRTTKAEPDAGAGHRRPELVHHPAVDDHGWAGLCRRLDRGSLRHLALAQLEALGLVIQKARFAGEGGVVLGFDQLLVGLVPGNEVRAGGPVLPQEGDQPAAAQQQAEQGDQDVLGFQGVGALWGMGGQVLLDDRKLRLSAKNG